MSETKNMNRIHILVECAVMVAVGFVLMSLKLFELPQGGSVTFASMLPFIIIAFRHGTKWGLLAGFACSLLQMLTGFWAPPVGTALNYALVVILDYVLPFTLLGLAALFAKPFPHRALGIAGGTVIVCIIRFLCHFGSGALIWSYYAPEGTGALIYSVGYNSFMLPESIITVVVALLLYKMMPKLFGTAE
ncbi:energy-coupled thiamine transporter ThiT [Agathobaculum sp.]|uniref:energy-coupled thiamine transporter ThiT n=1 Tax=Agathobaculum sp. TaxID=2048138 RepID=UPI002A7F2FFE|nr:energy-coupled thiamine transporter ThiT [Agathobaculum sp.]MDY3619398.1 energy-coupled thiamine transporter ThiT [Agathobaculum sp.]